MIHFLPWPARRAALLAGIAVAAVLLFGRLAQMQLLQRAEYLRMSEENRVRMVSRPAARGLVIDRNGVTLIGNRPSFVVSVLPTVTGWRAPVLPMVASVLGIDSTRVRRAVRAGAAQPYEPVPIKRDVDFRTICYIEEHDDQFPGIHFGTESVRRYPSDGWGGHVLGYVREISSEELARRRAAGRYGGRFSGATGIEKSHDESLSGADGVEFLETSALGRVAGSMPGYKNIPPTPGALTQLTIDVRLQRLADSLLAGYGAGCAVVLDVATGAVLCLVSHPGFDANTFSGVLPPDEWKRLSTDSLHPLLHRSLKGLYPPGSTAKLLTAAAGLEHGVVTARQKRYRPCTGAFRFGNRVAHCHDRAGHGILDLKGAITASCDVYFYQLGLELGLDRWAATAAASGLGTKTGIDLPGEEAGLAPDRAWYDNRYGKRGWTRGILLNLAIGQGEILSTPLQLAVHYAAIANNGTAHVPYLVQSQWPADRPAYHHRRAVAYRLPYSPSTIATLKDAAVAVVQHERGTAHLINDPDCPIAGKTGTAENPHGNEHAWFTGFAPAIRPRIAFAVLVENAGHGSTVAAPIALALSRLALGIDTLHVPDTGPSLQAGR